jgi:hypothetical protein
MTHHVALREVVGRAIHETWCAEEGLCLGRDQDVAKGTDLAIELQTQLHAAGYAIHALDGRCVRVPGEAPGRKMTPDERVLLGLATAGDALDEAGQP